MDRRRFLRATGLVSTSLFLPRIVKAMPTGLGPVGRRLVVVQLTGGNDGLNTVVPFRDDTYHRERSGIAIPAGKVLRLSDELGLHPACLGLKRLFDNGMVRVINGVGYPAPDRSHFRSMDIWHTASGSERYLSTGWLGRYLDANGAAPHGIIELSGQLSLANKGARRKGLAFRDPAQFHAATREPYFARLNHGEASAHQELNYLYATVAGTFQSADVVAARWRQAPDAGTWPKGPLSRQLRTVARLIRSGLDTRVYYTGLPGFDTHVQQPGKHHRMLAEVGDALGAFMDDMRRAGLAEEVVVMVFSEFGRRVRQNRNQGTDHGTAGPVMLIGGGVNGGIHNAHPSLTDLDTNGDLRFAVDHRNIYASLLTDWLDGDPAVVLGADIPAEQGLFR